MRWACRCTLLPQEKKNPESMWGVRSTQAATAPRRARATPAEIHGAFGEATKRMERLDTPLLLGRGVP